MTEKLTCWHDGVFYTEEWRDIAGYEGAYQVSSFGRIKSLDKISSRGHKLKCKILKLNKNGFGYKHFSLFKNGKKKTCRVHVLVAETFLGHVPDGTHRMVVDHKDNIKSNNHTWNLQLITNRENVSKDRSGGTSEYVGVFYDKDRGKWRADITVGNKKRYLGSFSKELDAANAYQKALENL